jgi:hypothetical protein
MPLIICVISRSVSRPMVRSSIREGMSLSSST